MARFLFFSKIQIHAHFEKCLFMAPDSPFGQEKLQWNIINEFYLALLFINPHMNNKNCFNNLC